MWFRKLLEYPDSLVLLADSAFKAEKDTGLSVRGTLALRCSKASTGLSGRAGTKIEDFSVTGTVHGHLIEWVSKTQRHVTRATFASELFGGTDAVDQGKLLQLSLHEISAGPGTLAELNELAEKGCLNVSLILILDAMSVVAAVAAPTIKPPAENGLLLHLKWVREQLDTNQLYAICWADTRSMAAVVLFGFVVSAY